MTVDVSVLVPVLNEEAHLPRALHTMLAQRVDGAAEFLLIDGGSTDRSLEIIEEHAERDPRVRLLHNPARRTPQALNIGLRAAGGTFVARMDAHAEYPPDYLQLGIDRLRRGDVVSVSGPQLAVGEGRWSRRVALALRSALGVGGARFRRLEDREFEVDSGFTGVWRRDVLVAAGGWDEDWPNDQDLELAARLRKDGGRYVCLPAMAASYIPRDSLVALARQYWRYGFYRVKTSNRHPESLRPSQLLPPLLTLSFVGAAVPTRIASGPARLGLLIYALALLHSTIEAAREEEPRDAAALPLVYVAMHVSYGVGFMEGCARWGLPVRAVSEQLKACASRALPDCERPT
jgi:succinoglycan biosynthesis protein ExoA